MKKVYKTPEMMAADMAECILNAGNPSLRANPNGSVAAESVGVKGEIWDDEWDE